MDLSQEALPTATREGGPAGQQATGGPGAVPGALRPRGRTRGARRARADSPGRLRPHRPGPPAADEGHGRSRRGQAVSPEDRGVALRGTAGAAASGSAAAEVADVDRRVHVSLVRPDVLAVARVVVR